MDNPEPILSVSFFKTNTGLEPDYLGSHCFAIAQQNSCK